MKMKVDTFSDGSFKVDLIACLQDRFDGAFSLERIKEFTYDLYWNAPSGKGLYTLERVQAYVEGYLAGEESTRD
jgi:hypothetical protein